MSLLRGSHCVPLVGVCVQAPVGYVHVKTSGGIVLFVGKWVEWGVGLFLSFQGRPMAFGNALAMVELALQLQLQLQLPATATARPDPSCIWDLLHI